MKRRSKSRRRTTRKSRKGMPWKTIGLVAGLAVGGYVAYNAAKKQGMI